MKLIDLNDALKKHTSDVFKCNQLGNNLKDVVDKYKKHEDASGALVKWLNVSEEESRRQQSEPIAGDPQTLQRQLEETKARALYQYIQFTIYYNYNVTVYVQMYTLYRSFSFSFEQSHFWNLNII